MNWSSRTCLRARPLLGTLVEISIDGEPGLNLHAAAETAFAAIAHVHSRMSRQDANSDLARLRGAASGTALQVDGHTIAVIREALDLAHRSAGAFNPCFVPGRTEHADFYALECLDETHLRRHRLLDVDLDGIAKGYAVDCAIEVLRATGVTRALVNAGGDLRVLGQGSERIFIRDPEKPRFAGACVSIEDEALATSAAYPTCDIDAKAAWHGCWSLSVAAPLAIHADALTKVVSRAPSARARQVLAFYQAQCWWLGAAQEQARAA